MAKEVFQADHQVDNVYSPLLPIQQRDGFAGLMAEFERLTDVHNGSSRASDACVDVLLTAEAFMRAALDPYNLPLYLAEQERAVYGQAMGVPNPPDFNELLGRVAAKFNARVLKLGREQGLDAVLKVLEQAGAVVTRPQTEFVRTDPSRARIQDSKGVHDDTAINQPAPKFEETIEALQSIGIFADQMVIHPGIVGQNTVRNAPYVVIQIPELDVELAVCNRVGEVILVNRPIIGPHLFAMHTKDQLVNGFKLDRVEYIGDWQNRLLALVLGDNPPDKAHRTRVNTQKFAKDQEEKSGRLTVPLVLAAMLEWSWKQYQDDLAKHPEKTPEWKLPTPATKGDVPGMPGRTWAGISSNGQAGCSGLLAGETLPHIQKQYGLKSGKNVVESAVEAAVTNWIERGTLPDRVEVDDTLTREKVLIAMLRWSWGQYQDDLAKNPDKKPEWKLPTPETKGGIPGMPGRTWRGINSNGREGSGGLQVGENLPHIQKQYGLKNGRNVFEFAVGNAVKNWVERAELPERGEVDDTLTREKVLIAMLEWSAQHHQETGTWTVPTQYTEGDVPGMPGRTWDGINSNGQKGFGGLHAGETLSQIQKDFGLKEGYKTVKVDALQKAVEDWINHKILPRDCRTGLSGQDNADVSTIVPVVPVTTSHPSPT